MSREHAIVERRHGAWYVTDSGSRHGTLVNTIAIDSDDPTRLYHEDLLGVGPWTFQVQCDGSGDTGAVAPEPEPAEPETPSAARFAAAPTDLYPTRATLLLRLGDSDEQVRELSWREFEERYRPVIVGYARKRGATDSEAEDILQDVLVGFFRVSDAFEYDPSKGKFRSYLGTAVKHAYVARRSRKKLAFGEVDLAAEREPGTEQTWAWQWTRGVLERALIEVRSQFEPRTIDAFELYGRRGVPADEVAQQLDMTNESVRHAKHRVARAVRLIIERIRSEEG